MYNVISSGDVSLAISEGTELPSYLIKKKQDKFLSRYNGVKNLFCRYCSKLWFFCAAVQRNDVFLLSNFICLSTVDGE